MFAFALRNLLSRPVRSVLALLGLTVAIMGMVGLFSVATGLQAMVNKTFGRIPGLVAMQPGAPIPLFSKIPRGWAEEIAALPGVAHVSREVWGRVQLLEGKPTFNPPRFLFGVDVDGILSLKTAIYRDDITAGRFLTPDDRGTFNTVVSRQVASDHRKQVGDVLRVDGFELTIVGIYETGSMLLDVAVLVDSETGRRILQFDPTFLSSIYIEPDGSIPNEALMEAIRVQFRGRGHATTLNLSQLTGAGQSASATLSDFAWSLLSSKRTNAASTDENAAGKPSTAAPQSNPPEGAGPPDSPAKSDPSTAVPAEVPARVAPVADQPPPERPRARATEKRTKKPSASDRPPAPAEGVVPAAQGSALSPPATGSATPVDEAIEVRSTQEWGQRVQEFSADLDIFLWLMNTIGVVIAVLSILNTMLMSVSERMIEFGVLRANGWSSRNVMQLIIAESALLGIVGGVLGCLLGWAGAQVVNLLFPSKLFLYASPGLLSFSLLFSTVLGILGGLYPAFWAIRLSPMDAIRRG